MTDPDRPARPRKRRIWAIAMLALAATAMIVTWRATSLSGLPDVGDPFDVRAFVAPKVDDDRNAFTLYRQAAKLITREPQGMTYDWATAGPAEKQWLETNRRAMDLWRRGTERPEALYINPGEFNFATLLPVIQELRSFARLAGLEGTRLEASGDMDGALTWYVAMLRSGRHCGTRGVIIERLVGMAINAVASRHLTRWAADPRVDAPMLRRAIDAALIAETLTRPTSEALKGEYLSMMNSIDDPRLMDPAMLGLAAPPTGKPESAMVRAFRDDIPKLLKREPERSRRVIRLVFANQLAYCDLPAAQQPPIAATLPPDYAPTAPGLKPGKPMPGTAIYLMGELFAVDPSASAAARAMPPAEVASWWDSTVYAKLVMPAVANYEKAIARERATQAALLATLRGQRESREHPQSPGAATGVQP